MNTRRSFTVLVLMVTFATPALADEALTTVPGGRAEIWLGVSNFPGLDDIRPVADGSFDATGFGIGGAWHGRVAQFEQSELLVGVDGFIAANDSNISGFFGDLAARHLYLGVSAKWALGASRSFYLDAGAGYHEIDMAELGDYWYGLEHVAWKKSTYGTFVGATWDIGASRPGSRGGLSLGFKVHFVDFGRVYDENVFLVRVLGEDAGELEGPVYMLQIGYGGR
jgi:hypothetical protein